MEIDFCCTDLNNNGIMCPLAGGSKHVIGGGSRLI